MKNLEYLNVKMPMEIDIAIVWRISEIVSLAKFIKIESIIILSVKKIINIITKGSHPSTPQSDTEFGTRTTPYGVVRC